MTTRSIRHVLTSALVTCFAVVTHAQVVLQNFSNVVGTNTYFYGTWEASSDAGGSTSPNTQFSQGSGVYSFTGTTTTIPTDDSASKVEFFNSTAVSISGYSYLSISAQALATNAATSFRVFLVDTSGKTASASFATSSFVTGTYTTAYGSLTFASGFNSASVDSLIISGDQVGGTAQFNIAFDNISAVSAIPEPSTYAAIFGAVALTVGVIRGRKIVKRGVD